jgi:hypothetical protein
MPRSYHDRIDPPVEQMINRGSRGSGQRDTHGSCKHEINRRQTRHGQEHADDRCENDQGNDARLAQFPVLAGFLRLSHQY